MGEEVARERLEAALKEQARLQDAYGRACGSSSEQSSYVRLQAVNLRVAVCDRLVSALRR
jgi:hypothetical protein